MMFNQATKSLFLLLALGTLTLCGRFEAVMAKKQMPVTAREGETADLTIVFPSRISSTFLVVKLDKENGSPAQDVLFAYPSANSFKLGTNYKNRLVANLNSPTLRMTLPQVTSQDAGVFKCYDGLDVTPLADCGQMLIIIRKPSPPVIEPASSALVGGNFLLTCRASSTSLPATHGLPTKIWWTDESGADIVPNGRIRVNLQDQLVVENIERGDEGQKFRCQSADSTEGQPLKSDRSPAYTLLPEFKPTREDLTVTPSLSNNEHVERQLNEQISYKCEAKCQPACNISWLYQPHNATRFGEVTGLTDRSVLQMYVSRTNEGMYRCKAENIHGVIRIDFVLEALYMSSPEITINGKKTNAERVLENSVVKLTCEFDANPQPTVKWTSPLDETLSSMIATGPSESSANNGINLRMYSSSLTLDGRQCEDSGNYKCSAANKASSADGIINLLFMCPPTSVKIPGLELQSQYVWEIPHTLSFQFVIRAVPPPEVTRVLSAKDESRQEEKLNQDFTITTSTYEGKAYLTHFTFSSVRPLTIADRGREFTMTLSSTEFVREFRFTIQPRGPPHEVQNVTAEEISHDSVMLFWRPGFNGGKEQTFTVDVQQFDPAQPERQTDKPWQLIQDNIADLHDGSLQWLEVMVKPLRPSTNYIMRVRAFNGLGNTSSEIEVKTAAAPDEGLAAGAIVGIVFAVLIIIIIIILVVLYFFVYKKRWGNKASGSGPNFKLPEQLTALFSKKDKAKQGRTRDDDEEEEAPKNGPIYKLKNRMKRKPDKTFVYVNVPVKEEPEFAMPLEADDGEYVNTEEMKRAGSSDNIYENAPALNNNTDGSKNQAAAGSDGRITNDDGLVYLSLEFPADKKKGGVGKAGKNKKDKSKPTETKKKERLDYADIDFSKTKLKQEELQAARKAEEAAAKKKAEEEEARKRAEEAAVVEDGDDAKDGGADDDGSGKAADKTGRIPEQDFGTAV